LVLHDDGVWDAVNDGSSLPLEELNVLCLVVTGAPGVLLAILAAFYDKY